VQTCKMYLPAQWGDQEGVFIRFDPRRKKARRSFLKASIPLGKRDKCRIELQAQTCMMRMSAPPRNSSSELSTLEVSMRRIRYAVATSWTGTSQD